MKLSARTLEDGREAERTFQIAPRNRPKQTRKSDLVAPTSKLPCDQCKGAEHPELEVLKYNPRRCQWLCVSCRVEVAA